MRFVFVIGTTDTASIDGISAAGATPSLMRHTPTADAEIIEYGHPVRAPVTPVSPAGCPTPAVITRAVREIVEFETTIVDAGTANQTAAPTITAGDEPGGDVRQAEPMPSAVEICERTRELGRRLPDDELVVAESIPGGTTTALGVLTALGEPFGVSSSLPENPVTLKRDVVSTALAESNLTAGGADDAPELAMETMGDPVLAAATGLVSGALEVGTTVTLAGGTQMLAVAALVRNYGIEEPLELATTSFVAADENADIRPATDELNVELTVTDPGFQLSDHVAFERYRQGEAKEGVGMGGALMLAARNGVSMERVREQVVSCYEEVVSRGS